MILAIDSSTSQAGVALMRDGDILAEISWIAAGNHSRTLPPALRNVLAAVDARITAVTAIAVASGPGSFSGLRVGLSAAKGLAMGLDVPLVGIPSLDVLGLSAVEIESPVWAVLSAGRGRVYLARYEGSWADLTRTSDYELRSVVDAAALIGGKGLTGEAAEEVVAAATMPHGVPTVLPPVHRLRRPAFLAELGRRYFDHGGTDQRDVLEPLYLRRSAAEEKRAAQLAE